MGGVIEEISGTGHEAGIIPNSHEESRFAFLASGCLIVPALSTSLMTKRTIHGVISVIVPFITGTFF